jgi:DNA processing protein
MLPDLVYQVALTLVPHIGCVQAKILLSHFGDAPAIFRAKKTDLEKIEGIGTIRAQSIKTFGLFSEAEKESAFIEKYAIQPLFLNDKKYPQRLLNCYDPPSMLYYKGHADLNSSRIIAVIGTRNNSDYGKQVTEKLVKDLSARHVLVVSGLAFGIDAIAHKAALKNHLSTIGVLGHGLDKIYPQEHAGLAREMITEGGLLTEFRSNTKPDKHHFPIRNRIVAGMADAVIVVETGIKGGSMITAELANGYNKDVFAFPGKTTDTKSAGCNQLIKNNKAVLLTDAGQMAELMGWEEETKAKTKKQKELFIELNDNEKKIIAILDEKDKVHIDELNTKSGLSNSTIAATILGLELQNLIISLPGKLYRLA